MKDSKNSLGSPSVSPIVRSQSISSLRIHRSQSVETLDSRISPKVRRDFSKNKETKSTEKVKKNTKQSQKRNEEIIIVQTPEEEKDSIKDPQIN